MIKRAIGVVSAASAGLTLALAPMASQAATKRATTGPPTVITGAARTVGISVTLTGTVDTHGLPTTYEFQYGPGTATGGAPASYASHTTAATLPAGTAKEKVSQTVSGLLPGYHYRLVAMNSADPTLAKTGKDRVYELQTKRAKSVFKLPSLEPTLVGEPFVLSGSLTGTGNAEREVVLQASPYPYAATFVDVGSPVATSSVGTFSFRVARLTTSTRFRVATVAAPILISPSITQLAEVHVSLEVRRSKRVEGLVRLYGTVSPAEAGAHVFLQLEQPPKAKPPTSEKPEKTSRTEEREKPPRFQTKFNTIVKRDGKTFSRFSIVVKVSDSGNYRAYVQLPAGPLASGQSQTVILHAAPSKKHKRA